MKRRQPLFIGIGLAVLAGAIWTASWMRATAQETNAFSGDELVETLTVTIHVAAEGQDLDEPVALDLGLGFPFWLHPVGRSSGETVPFGAVPQQTTATTKVAAGDSATFTFSLAGDTGQDILRATPQLLDGVRVSDIARIGFASPRRSDWMLAGYELKINGQTLAVDDSGIPEPDPAQTALIAKLAEVDKKGEALGQEYDTLRAAIKANTATAADLKRVQEIESEGKALSEQRDALASQVQVNRKSAKATREADLDKLDKLDMKIQALRWESVPATAAAASTTQDVQSASRNGEATTQDAQAPPQAPAATAQQGQDDGQTAAGVEATESQLDDSLEEERKLLTGRLGGLYPWFVDDQFAPIRKAEGEVRQAKVTVETCSHAGADTQNYVYFSTGGRKYPLNSQYVSMSAEDGPQEFEIDLVAGPLAAADLRGWALGVLAVPEPQDSVPDRWHPQRLLVEIDESIVYDSDESPLDRQSLDAVRVVPPAQLDENGQPMANSLSAREVYVWEAGEGLGLDLAGGGALPLPEPGDADYPQAESGLADVPAGSEGLEESGDYGDLADSGFPPDSPPFPGETGPGPGDSSGSQSGGGGGGGGGQANTPPPAGGPFQMKKVSISQGWKLNEPFTIDWEVSGDTSGIDHFLVSMRAVRPDKSQGLFGHVMTPAVASVGQRSRVVQATISTKEPCYYLAPCVTAVTKDPSKQNPQSHAMIGPARAVFPASANNQIQPFPKDFTYQPSGGGASQPKPITVGPPPAGAAQRGAWIMAQPTTPLALQVGLAKPGSHLAVRPQHNDTFTVRCDVPKFSGQQQLVGHVGFMGKTNAADSVDVKMECNLIGSGTSYTYSWKGNVSTNVPPKLVEQVLKASDLGLPIEKAEIKFTFSNGGSTDPKCMPGVYGLRLLPVAAGSAPNTTPVHAHLAIDRAASSLIPGNVRFQPNTPVPQLVVVNQGPEDVPPDVLKSVKVKVVYYLAPYGKHWGEIDSKQRQEIHCGPNPVVQLAPGQNWQGPLKVGQSMKIVPTDLNTSLAQNKALLGGDGKLKSQKAVKLFMTWANIQLPGKHLLDDPNPDKGWLNELADPIVVGKGPLPFEVVAFQGANFQGARESYELNPQTQRQRLIWDLGQEANKIDMYQKVASVMVGQKVRVGGSKEHHFFSDDDSGLCYYEGPGFDAGVDVPLLGSLVIFPEGNWWHPIGVSLHSGWPDIKGMFFPLPEDKNVKHAEFTSIPGVLNDKADDVYVWRHPDKKPGSNKPRGWVRATLYEDSNLGGRTCTLGGESGYDLGERIWDGWTGGITVEDEVSSLKLEAIGETYSPP